MTGSLPCGCDHDAKKPHLCERHQAHLDALKAVEEKVKEVVQFTYEDTPYVKLDDVLLAIRTATS